ncbi:MAG: ribonuclease P protein component [Alphaproteobacteria bacterium]|nr:MAG: ribonuclease P protein component [Alphaproteobacteria bacterium]
MTTLKKRADFLRASAAGEKKATQNIVVQVFRRTEDDGGIRVGFTATKKTGNAVRRNRIKRRLRALARNILPQSAEGGFDVVLIGRWRAAESAFSELERDFLYALKKLGVKAG